MIVGRKDIDFTKLKLACRSEDSLLRFTGDLVPTPLRHIREVVDNQKYLVALHVRSMQSLPWQKRKDLCEHLLHGARIKGVPDTIYDYSDLLLAIDSEAFERYLREEDQRAEG